MDRKWWTLVAVCVATFMLLLDITIVNVALPDDRARARRELRRPPVGDRRLRADARRAAADRRLARRPARPPPGLRRSASRSSPSPRCCARSPARRLVLNLARALQGVGGAFMFATSLALLASRLPGPRPRHRVRRLGRGHRRLGGGRPAGRRRADRRHRLGGDLPRQRADRDRARSRSRSRRSRSRTPRAAAGIDWPGCVTFSGGLFAADLRAHPRQRRGLGRAR